MKMKNTKTYQIECENMHNFIFLENEKENLIKQTEYKVGKIESEIKDLEDEKNYSGNLIQRGRVWS